MKCKKCKHSVTRYSTFICAWEASCELLGTSKTISEYTEDEENAPEWDSDLGRCNPYCDYYLDNLVKQGG